MKMTTHSFEITNPRVHPRSHMFVRAESMTATLVVRPPFEVPDKGVLRRVALGVDSWDMEIAHTENVDGDASYFEISAADGSEQANRVTLQHLGERIVRFANDPSQASTMMREGPFAIQEE